ncbi:MAG: YbjQ family protein [Xanthomonadales bacterium]|nr:YbjQ family protein [Xanthomonadales bacterium]
MIITPGASVIGQPSTKTLGLVRGNTIRARHIGKDILAVFKNIVGGEIEEYTKMMGEAREQAIDRMVAEALSLDADAVVNVLYHLGGNGRSFGDAGLRRSGENRETLTRQGKKVDPGSGPG